MSEGGGGHGGNWIVTYADMITLLMAGFIVIVTFGSRESDKLSPRGDSAVAGQGGTGIAGALRKGPDKDSVVVRPPPRAGNAYDRGSEMPSLYSDVPTEVTRSIQTILDNIPDGRLSDDFEIALPMGLMFEEGDALSQAGKGQLERIAKQIRKLPYEVLIRVSHPREISMAVSVYRYLFQTCDLTPLRLGVGIKSDTEKSQIIWIMLRKPTG